MSFQNQPGSADTRKAPRGPSPAVDTALASARHNLTAAALDQMPLGEVAALPVAALDALNEEITRELDRWEQRKKALVAAIGEKYASQAQAAFTAAHKDGGTVRFKDEGYEIICEAKRAIIWDQKKLTALRERMIQAGDDPAVYMRAEYKIAEAAFATWPDAVKAAFTEARTVKVGRPSFRMEPTEDVKS